MRELRPEQLREHLSWLYRQPKYYGKQKTQKKKTEKKKKTGSAYATERHPVFKVQD